MPWYLGSSKRGTGGVNRSSNDLLGVFERLLVVSEMPSCWPAPKERLSMLAFDSGFLPAIGSSCSKTFTWLPPIGPASGFFERPSVDHSFLRSFDFKQPKACGSIPRGRNEKMLRKKVAFSDGLGDHRFQQSILSLWF